LHSNYHFFPIENAFTGCDSETFTPLLQPLSSKEYLIEKMQLNSVLY
jgi:hypothetical protein